MTGRENRKYYKVYKTDKLGYKRLVVVLSSVDSDGKVVLCTQLGDRFTGKVLYDNTIQHGFNNVRYVEMSYCDGQVYYTREIEQEEWDKLSKLTEKSEKDIRENIDLVSYKSLRV